MVPYQNSYKGVDPYRTRHNYREDVFGIDSRSEFPETGVRGFKRSIAAKTEIKR